MDIDKVIQLLIDIKERLGHQDAKIQEICRNTAKLSQRVNDLDRKLDILPCEQHRQDIDDRINARVSGATFLTVLTLLVTFIAGAYAFTWSVSLDLHKHEVHFSTYNVIDKITGKSQLKNEEEEY